MAIAVASRWGRQAGGVGIRAVKLYYVTTLKYHTADPRNKYRGWNWKAY